jgi:hypothetical protein
MSRKITGQTFFQNHDRHDHRNGVWQTIENVYSTDVSIFTFISAFLKKKLRNQHMTTMLPSSGGAGNGSTLRVGDLAIRDLGWNISR